jgi:hypothetical protein
MAGSAEPGEPHGGCPIRSAFASALPACSGAESCAPAEATGAETLGSAFLDTAFAGGEAWTKAPRAGFAAAGFLASASPAAQARCPEQTRHTASARMASSGTSTRERRGRVTTPPEFGVPRSSLRAFGVRRNSCQPGRPAELRSPERRGHAFVQCSEWGNEPTAYHDQDGACHRHHGEQGSECLPDEGAQSLAISARYANLSEFVARGAERPSMHCSNMPSTLGV